MAKRMTEQIAAAEKSVSEQIENARIRAAQIAADAKDKAKKSEEAILKRRRMTLRTGKRAPYKRRSQMRRYIRKSIRLRKPPRYKKRKRSFVHKK